MQQPQHRFRHSADVKTATDNRKYEQTNWAFLLNSSLTQSCEKTSYRRRAAWWCVLESPFIRKSNSRNYMSDWQHRGSDENIVLLLCQFKLTTSAYQQLQTRMQPPPWSRSAACIQDRQKDRGCKEQRTRIRLHLHVWKKRIARLVLRCEGFFFFFFLDSSSSSACLPAQV